MGKEGTGDEGEEGKERGECAKEGKQNIRRVVRGWHDFKGELIKVDKYGFSILVLS